MKRVINNLKILTMNSQSEGIIEGSLCLDGDQIIAVGELPSDFVPDDVIDGSNHLAMPGFINAHTHMGMSLFRNYADDMPLMQWLNDKIWPIEANLTAEDVYYGSLLSMVELIKCGCTTFRDMYFFMNEVAQATEKSGLRANLGLGLVGVSDPTGRGFDEVRKLYSLWHGKANGRIQIEVAPHAPYTCSDDYLVQATQLALELKCPLHIHLSESQFEVKQSLEQHGKTPIKHMNDLGVFKAKTSGAHCVHLQNDDINIIKENDVSVLYNPSSNLKLGNGFAPVHHLISAGVNVALGTDGASSNNNLNMLEELHLGALINKGIQADPTVLPAYKMLEIATINGARALGIDAITGTLEVGKKADIILFDLKKPHLTPAHDLVAMIVYSASASDISHVFCDGKLLMDNYQLTTLDEREIMKITQVLADQLVKRTIR